MNTVDKNKFVEPKFFLGSTAHLSFEGHSMLQRCEFVIPSTFI